MNSMIDTIAVIILKTKLSAKVLLLKESDTSLRLIPIKQLTADFITQWIHTGRKN